MNAAETPGLSSRLLGTLRLDMGEAHDLGITPSGWRRMRVLPSGSLIGPRINATGLPGGLDAFLRKSDGTLHTDARLTLKTHDSQLIYLSYRGVRYGTPEVMARIEANQPVRQDEYYLRNVPTFETASAAYEWLNRIVAVGVGRREPQAVACTIYEIL
jgi:hypothetical protein